MNNRIKFSLGGGISGLVLLAALALIWGTPNAVFSHGKEKHSHDLEKIPAKPEGMIEFGKDPAAGSEYAEDPPTEGMDHSQHDMGHMDHGMKPGPFHERGTHDMGNLQKPKTKAQALLNRGRNIFLHMCVYCHGEDGNGGGTATDYLYPWPRDFRKGIFKFRSTPTGTLPKDEDLYRTIINGVPGYLNACLGRCAFPTRHLGTGQPDQKFFRPLS